MKRALLSAFAIACASPEPHHPNVDACTKHRYAAPSDALGDLSVRIRLASTSFTLDAFCFALDDAGAVMVGEGSGESAHHTLADRFLVRSGAHVLRFDADVSQGAGTFHIQSSHAFEIVDAFDVATRHRGAPLTITLVLYGEAPNPPNTLWQVAAQPVGPVAR